MHCKIDFTDRLNRLLMGVLLVIFAFSGFAIEAMLALGIIQLLEGATARCALSCLLVKGKQLFSKPKQG